MCKIKQRQKHFLSYFVFNEKINIFICLITLLLVFWLLLAANGLPSRVTQMPQSLNLGIQSAALAENKKECEIKSIENLQRGRKSMNFVISFATKRWCSLPIASSKTKSVNEPIVEIMPLHTLHGCLSPCQTNQKLL